MTSRPQQAGRIYMRGEEKILRLFFCLLPAMRQIAKALKTYDKAILGNASEISFCEVRPNLNSKASC